MKKTKQSGRSRQKLTGALFALMETEAFDSITITAITKKAGVARLTFYRHFETKEEILLEHFAAVFHHDFEDACQAGRQDLREALCGCFASWQRDGKMIRLLIGHGLQRLLHRPFSAYLQRVLSDCVLPWELNGLQRRFIEGGLFLSLLDWVEDANGPAPEDMAAMILAVISSGESGRASTAAADLA